MEEKSSNKNREHGLNPQQRPGAGRLFVDMDGTLAKYQPAESMEILFEKGYFLHLEPQQKVVDAVKKVIAEHPDIPVYIMSSVLSDSRYALQEKQEWLDRYLPEIDQEHRIFPPCGENKLYYVPGGSRPSDYLLDDYTNNLTQWEPPAKGIKLLNGINHSKESWMGSMLRYDKEPDELAEHIMEVMEGRALIRDERPLHQKIQMANQDYDTKVKVGYVSEELRSRLTYLTKEQALGALQEGIHICCMNDYKEYHGSHADEYSFTELSKVQEVKNLYGTWGSGVIHKACISPYYQQPGELKELLQKREQDMHPVRQETEQEKKREMQHIPHRFVSL